MRSYARVSLSSIELDDDTMVEKKPARAAERRVSKGTVAIALALVAFACTFVGAGWNAVSHAPVARAAATVAATVEPKAPAPPDSEREDNVVSVPAVKLAAPWATAPTRTVRAGIASVRASTPGASAAAPKAVPAAPAPAARPAPAPDQDSASVRDINAKASSVLESSL
jgi:hypothetical protein